MWVWATFVGPLLFATKPSKSRGLRVAQVLPHKSLTTMTEYVPLSFNHRWGRPFDMAAEDYDDEHQRVRGELAGIGAHPDLNRPLPQSEHVTSEDHLDNTLIGSSTSDGRESCIACRIQRKGVRSKR